jgi:hypothetical protein
MYKSMDLIDIKADMLELIYHSIPIRKNEDEITEYICLRSKYINDLIKNK